MPRPRGGKRQGANGTAYANRSDMNTKLPVTTVPGQGYGEAGKQAESQQAVPMSAGPAPQIASPVGPPAAGPQPGERLFDRSTERPHEPVTAGLSIGAGPGPEVLSQFNAAEDELDRQQLAKYLPSLELLASAPDASVTTRNFVRRIRGTMPMEQP